MEPADRPDRDRLAHSQAGLVRRFDFEMSFGAGDFSAVSRLDEHSCAQYNMQYYKQESASPLRLHVYASSLTMDCLSERVHPETVASVAC